MILRIVPNIWHPTAFLDVIIDFSGFHDCASGSQSNTGVITFMTLGVAPHSQLFTNKSIRPVTFDAARRLAEDPVGACYRPRAGTRVRRLRSPSACGAVIGPVFRHVCVASALHVHVVS